MAEIKNGIKKKYEKEFLEKLDIHIDVENCETSYQKLRRGFLTMG